MLFRSGPSSIAAQLGPCNTVTKKIKRVIQEWREFERRLVGMLRRPESLRVGRWKAAGEESRERKTNDTTYWRVWGPTNAIQAVLVKVLRAFRHRRSPWCLYAEEGDGRLNVQASGLNKNLQATMGRLTGLRER